MDRNIKILCAFHNNYPILDDISDTSIYIPVFGGSALSNGVIDEKFKRDDVGENISYLNREINEITILYWAWKNYEKIGNPEYIGLNHYRRFLIWKYEDLDDNSIIAHHVNLGDTTIYKQYLSGHIISDFDRFNSHFFDILTPIQKIYYSKYLECGSFYGNNMFIMHKNMFFSYMNFMNDCVNIVKSMLENNEVNLNDGRIQYQKRAFSFILERITGFFIYFVNNNDGIKLINVERKNINCD